jgi:phytanoyl-CoA hydroxylase
MQTMLDQFAVQGFVVIENVFDLPRDFQPVIDDYALALDDLARQWHGEGKISSTYRNLPFNRRFMKIVAEACQPWSQYFDISLPQKDVTADTPIHLSEAVFNLLRTPRLLDIVEQFIGPEIYCNPIQHVRIKPPEHLIPPDLRRGLGAQTDWHQDQGVALPEADDTDILTVWFSITDATEENGCLRVVPGSHRTDLATHCPGGKDGGLHIPEKLLGSQPVPLPMKRGSVLFMHRRTKHSSLPNISDDIRWSFDLRYQPTGRPTGRPAFPGFIARSRQHPQNVLTDYRAWIKLWHDARSRLAQEALPAFNRWTGDSPVCA